MSATHCRMREIAASLPPGDEVAKILNWADVHIGDQFERIYELEEELKETAEAIDKMTEAFAQLRAVCAAAQNIARDASPVDLSEQFGHDFVGHINLMGGAWEDPDYRLKSGLTCRHTDTRGKTEKPKAKAPKKSKATP